MWLTALVQLQKLCVVETQNWNPIRRGTLLNTFKDVYLDQNHISDKRVLSRSRDSRSVVINYIGFLSTIDEQLDHANYTSLCSSYVREYFVSRRSFHFGFIVIDTNLLHPWIISNRIVWYKYFGICPSMQIRIQKMIFPSVVNQLSSRF